MDIASLRAKLDNIAEELAQLPEQESVAIEEETIEEAHMVPKTLKCKDCGDTLGNPTTDCPCDSMDPKGDNWIMVDVDNDGDMDMAVANEEQAVEEGFAVGASVAPSEEGPDQAPGKVIAVDGDKVTVKFMDGSTEVFAQDELFALPAGLKFGEELDEEPNEGNEFSGALAQAKKDGKEEFEVDGKVYKVKEDEIEEGRMSDLAQEIDEVAAEMEQNDMLAPFVDDFITMVQKTYDIKAALEAVLPDYVPGDMIRDLVGEAVEEVQEVDEVAESIAKMAAMAGVGSTAKSNHGIHEGEEGYQLTPRSIVAREMRKLQDIERGSK